jgi:hypothetical protein
LPIPGQQGTPNWFAGLDFQAFEVGAGEDYRKLIASGFQRALNLADFVAFLDGRENSV